MESRRSWFAGRFAKHEIGQLIITQTLQPCVHVQLGRMALAHVANTLLRLSCYLMRFRTIVPIDLPQLLR